MLSSSSEQPWHRSQQRKAFEPRDHGRPPARRICQTHTNSRLNEADQNTGSATIIASGSTAGFNVEEL